MAASLRLRVGLTSLMALALLSLGTSASGTSCAEPLPLDQAIDDAGTVFVGTVIQLEYDGQLAVFSVEEVWKGEVGATVMASGGPSPADLGEAETTDGTIVPRIDRRFEVGSTYLVVPWGVEEGIYLDDGCSATQLFDSALDQYRPESAHPPTGPGIESGQSLVVARVALAVIAALGAGAWLISRARQRGGQMAV